MAASLTLAATTTARVAAGAVAVDAGPGDFGPGADGALHRRAQRRSRPDADGTDVAGDSPRVLHRAGAIAKSVGALFLRSYERGERVYLAMPSRGYDGTVPPLVLGPGGTVRAPVREWTVAMLPSIAAVAVATSAWVLR